MALGAATVWEVRTGGNDANGGGFDVGNANFATDGAATSATGTAPVFTSASYNFAARDVGAWLFIKSGTNWVPGWYQIASVAANAATLTATIGSVLLYGGATNLNTSAGCATTASPTGATWSVDYSQQTAAGITFTDMVIDGATNTKFTSAGNPVGKNMVGNLIKVSSGTGFTVQTVEVVSTSGTTATCDKSLGTLSSTGGNGILGGAKLTVAGATSLVVAGNKVFVKSGTYQIAAGITLSGGANVTPTAPATRLIGYYQTRGDIITQAGGGISNSANRPLIQLITNSGLTAITISGTGWVVENLGIDCNSLTTSTGVSMSAGSTWPNLRNVRVANFTTGGIVFTGGGLSTVTDCEVTGGTSAATAAVNLSTTAGHVITRLNIHDNACTGILGSATFSNP